MISGRRTRAVFIPSSRLNFCSSTRTASVGMIAAAFQTVGSKFSCRLSWSCARPITPSALMMSWSAVAMLTSVWTTSIGASDPTSILIFVMRFNSTAIALASSLTLRLSYAYARSQ